MARRAPEATPEDLERFRIALENEIARTTLRATARKVRMSPSGLTKFLEGTKPYGRTVARVREWYYSEAGVHRTPPELIAAQLRRYVVTLPNPDRGLVNLLEAVDASYRQAGMFPPEWVRTVRALVR
ncbi:MAG TPA: hypothetical protein VF092_01285 [Longimicrobium sp.]